MNQQAESTSYHTASDLLRNGTQQEITEALVNGDISQTSVYRYRCNEASPERKLITGQALKAANKINRANRKVVKQAQRNNDPLDVIAACHPGDAEEISQYVLDVLAQQIKFAKLAYGVDMTYPQAISVAVYNMVQSQQQ